MTAADEANERAPSPVLELRGLADRSDIPPLCARVYCLAYDSPPGVVICDVSGADKNFLMVEALLRLQLTARRLGWTILIRHACGDLRQLLTLTGLDEALEVEEPDVQAPDTEAPDVEASDIEAPGPPKLGCPSTWSVRRAGRQPEHGEPLGGVEEGVEPDDLAP